jgi:hypothetical protein
MRKVSHLLLGVFHHSCPRFVAQFISLRVSHLHSIDDTISRLEIVIDGSGCHFSQLLSGSIDISDSAKSFLISIATTLENTELHLVVQEEMIIGNVIDRF